MPIYVPEDFKHYAKKYSKKEDLHDNLAIRKKEAPKEAPKEFPKESPKDISFFELLLEDYLKKKKGNFFLFYSLFNEFERYSSAKEKKERNGNSAILSYLALERASQIISLSSYCTSLVTAPVSKERITDSINTKFYGHTNYLSEFFKTETLMLLHGEKLSVVPLTVHIPLNSVSKKVKEICKNKKLSLGIVKLLKKILELPSYNTREKKLAMCSFNPHAGEGGLLGREELDYIKDFLSFLQKHDLPIEGPFASDALFLENNRRRYRLIIGWYHDQVLTPFKALEGYRGVNCTIGLPFLRVSPDHGTAFDIAKRGLAISDSMEACLDLVFQ